MKKAVLFFIIITFIGFNAFSQPFGIRFGMNLEELKTVATIIKETEKGQYLILPNKKSNSFLEYKVVLSPHYGVFALNASGREIESDEYGEVIKTEVEFVVKMLTEVYGEPGLKVDKLKEGSIWKEPRDWLTSLRKKERDYTFMWRNGLSNDIDLIALKVAFKNTYSNICRLELIYYSVYADKGYKDLEEDNPF